MKRSAPSQNNPRSSKKKQNKDVPRRPLSAYNIYFKLVRPMLIESHERGIKQPDFDTHLENSVKAGKPKPQGALFQAASRTLAERWKAMPPAKRQPFEEQAQEEMKKYRVQLEAYERKKTAEEKAAADNSGTKLKEAPKPVPGDAVLATQSGESTGTTTTKGARPQQVNLSDSEATTISSKSDPSGSRNKVFVQQSSSMSKNNRGSDTSSQSQNAQSFETNTPNVIGTSDTESLSKPTSTESADSSDALDALSRAVASMLTNQLGGGGNSNNGNEDFLRSLAAAALTKNLRADPSTLLLLVLLLLQLKSNPPQQVSNAPACNPIISLLSSLIQNNNMPTNAAQTSSTTPPTYTTNHSFQMPNIFHNLAQPRDPSPPPPPPVQVNAGQISQAALVEKLSQLSDAKRVQLKKFIENQASGLSQSRV